MSLPFPYITENTNKINTGSYLNKSEMDMFLSGFGMDLWYGFSEKDVIELSVFDLDGNPIGWNTIDSEKEYKKITLTYLNSLNRPVTYSYNELLSNFILYKNSKILVNPISDVSSSFGITRGSYILTYNFIREMAGQPNEPLVVKDISPSRKEVKLIPLRGNNPRYESFCKKNFQIKDVAPLLLQLTEQCPCDQIYSKVKEKYVAEIEFLKQLMFLDTDSAVVSFLRSLYQDVFVYTVPPENQPLDTVKRTQGIQGYFHNYLLSNYETISNFLEIDNTYDEFVTLRIEQQFKPYGTQKGDSFVNVKKFLVEFFTTYFYHPITLNAKKSFEDKYYNFFKNAINLGNNQMAVILDHAYLDERVVPTDPLTLLVKLKSELPETVKIQTSCWVSNISIAPFVINAIFRSPVTGRTIKISSPDFTQTNNGISLYNSNQSFTAADLTETTADQYTIDINKKISDLAVDYTSFSNFIVFSSAQQRVNNFKNKISSWYTLSSSMVILDHSASMSLASGYLYPQYGLERGSLEGQMTEIINSFDGYESYLFKTGSYAYSPSTSTFVSSAYVEDQDYSASIYDKTNRDSLINNTPEHIVLDDGNDEYLTFLNMVGHFFDNIYLYITNIPSERVVENDSTRAFSKKMVDYMLDAFGWELGTTYEDLTTLQTYTTATTSSLSEEDRTKAIRTRILNTLPQIYKTKGTSEAIKLLIACYGIPSNLLDIREYGHDTNVSESQVTYTKRERACLIGFSGSTAAYIDQTYGIKPNIRTIEFKLSLGHPEIYPLNTHYPFVSCHHIYTKRWDTNWYYHTSHSYSIPDYEARGYYELMTYPAWQIGFFREYGDMGRIYAVLPTLTSSLEGLYSGSQISYAGSPTIFLTSSILPLFDGDIFNIRLRRNLPDENFQYFADENNVPTIYDLTVQRNKAGRKIFRSISSAVGHYEDNIVWDGKSANDVWETTGSLGATTSCSIYWGNLGLDYINDIYIPIYAALGNAMVWDVPISDQDFEVHCNDFSSFAYSGSDAEKHLITRMDADEATNFLTSNYTYKYIYPPYYFSFGEAQGTIPNKSEYYSTFLERYGVSIRSGSWIGYKTGSLTCVENFSGSLWGIVSPAAISGSGQGRFFDQQSSFRGFITGSMSGSFNGIASGHIESVAFNTGGFFGGGFWVGAVYASDLYTQSYFSGSYTGSGSGSFWGITTGQMTSSTFGMFSGSKTTPWIGQLTGSLTGSVKTIGISGSFRGIASGSLIRIRSFGNYDGTIDRIWYGTLTGSIDGNFTGSTQQIEWTGSSIFIRPSPLSNPIGQPHTSKIWFSGSMQGVVSGSATCPAIYATGAFVGAFLQPWTGSQTSLYQKPIMPYSITYHSEFEYYPLHATRSSQQLYCTDIEISSYEPVYPYEYFVEDCERTYTTTNYGPNRFKNEKIHQRTQGKDVRVDDKDRSTYDVDQDIAGDSNLLGLYLDPQDAKNRDIVKFFGNSDIIGAIADPSNMYSSSYESLYDLNIQYNSFGDREVLYNELITLYKIYFNRSIFDSVKNIIPARTNVRTGIIVEPTVLERPKYKHHPVATDFNTGSAQYFDVTASHHAKDPWTKLVRFSGSVSGSTRNSSAGRMEVLWGEFNIPTEQTTLNPASIPPNPTMDLNASYVNEANFIYPNNYYNGYIPDLMDTIQLGNFGSLGNFGGYPAAWGVTTQDDLNKGTHHSGSKRYFLVKKWDKYTIYEKTGEYSRVSSKSDDSYSSNSIWLYSLVSMPEDAYKEIFYTEDSWVPSGSVGDLTYENPSIFSGYPYYRHMRNTAKGTPNSKTNNIKSYPSVPPLVYPTLPIVTAGVYNIAQNTFFEVFGGYPRNHYTHKRMQYSPVKFVSFSGRYKSQTAQLYIRNRQTIDTTIDDNSGLEDSSLPVQTIGTSNVNMVRGDNVINQ